MPRIHVEIAGQVQGVGFRWFARERARRLGVAGWVRNRDDGRVEVAAAADQETLDRFLADLRKGPPGSIVSDVRDLGEPELDLPEPFTIRH